MSVSSRVLMRKVHKMQFSMQDSVRANLDGRDLLPAEITVQFTLPTLIGRL